MCLTIFKLVSVIALPTRSTCQMPHDHSWVKVKKETEPHRGLGIKVPVREQGTPTQLLACKKQKNPGSSVRVVQEPLAADVKEAPNPSIAQNGKDDTAPNARLKFKRMNRKESVNKKAFVGFGNEEHQSPISELGPGCSRDPFQSPCRCRDDFDPWQWD